MSRYVYFILIVLLAGVIQSAGLRAQQTPRFSQYMFNALLYNPAAAGNTGNFEVKTMLRNQWIGLEGAPNSNMISIDGSVMRKKIGLAAVVVCDNAALLSQREYSAKVSYRKRTGNESWLGMGMGFALVEHAFDGTKAAAYTANDLSIPATYSSIVRPDLAAGIYYFDEVELFSLSADNLLPYSIDYTEASRETKGKNIPHYYMTMGYNYYMTKQFRYRVLVSAKTDLIAPMQVDVTPLIEYKQSFAMGVSYRPNESASVIIRGKILDKIWMGYAYDYQINLLGSSTTGSHEMMLSYTIEPHKKIMKNPRYF